MLFRTVVATDVASGSHPVPMTETIDPDLPPARYATLVAAAERLVAAVDFDTGFIHSEWILEDGVARLVECAGRLAGNQIMVMIGYAYSYDIVAAYLAVMSGEPLDVAPPARPQSAAMMLTKRVRPGRVTAVTGAEAARTRAGVLALEVSVAEGDQVGELVSLPDAAARVATYFRPDRRRGRPAGADALAVLEVSTVPVQVEEGREGVRHERRSQAEDHARAMLGLHHRIRAPPTPGPRGCAPTGWRPRPRTDHLGAGVWPAGPFRPA